MKSQKKLKFFVLVGLALVTYEFATIWKSGVIQPFFFNPTLSLLSVIVLYFIKKGGFYSKKWVFILMGTAVFIGITITIIALNWGEGRSSYNPYMTAKLRVW